MLGEYEGNEMKDEFVIEGYFRDNGGTLILTRGQFWEYVTCGLEMCFT